MAVSPRVYRSLLRLYPSEFRHEFGIDLALHFDDLVAGLGTGKAWRQNSTQPQPPAYSSARAPQEARSQC